MKTFYVSLALAGALLPVRAIQAPLTVDTNASTLQLQLCVLDTCDTKTSALRGRMILGLDSSTPAQIALQDFDVQAVSDYNFVLNYGLLGRIDATVAGLRIYHADPGPHQPFVPIVADTFVVTNVPFLANGNGDYTAQGGVCSLLQLGGRPCSTNFSLADLGTNYAQSITGTIQVSNDMVYARITFSFSGPLDPSNTNLATLAGTADIQASGPLPRPLVPLGSVWKYRDDGSDQGLFWRLLTFNDSAWASGPAELGYGDGDEATLINGGPADNHFITTYFRHAFNVPDPTSYTNLFLRLRRDDGAVVYLNATEIFRSNMPDGGVTYTTPAASAVSGAAETAFFGTSVSPARLRPGTNVLAVEVHQANPTSSDVSFDLELAGNVTVANAPPQLAITDPPDGAFIPPGNISISATALDPDGLVAFVEFYAGANKIGVALTEPFAMVWPDVSPGTYLLTARATDNYSQMITSAPVQITVTEPPVVLVSAGATWRYLDNGLDQGIAWRNLEFNDSPWPLGVAQLGFGDGDEATLIASNRQMTTYFRHAFVVSDADLCTNLLVRLLRDDGGVVYLNGTEVFRSNMPTNETILYTTPASSSALPEDETSRFYTASISPSLLLSGTNVLAAEIHQNNPTSSDLSFDLELLAFYGIRPPILRITLTEGTLQLSWPVWAGGFALYSTTNLTPPVTWSLEPATPFLTNGQLSVNIKPELEMQFFRLLQP
jgi:hypothetical protein